MSRNRCDKLWTMFFRHSRRGRAEHRALVKHRRQILLQAADAQARYRERAQLRAAEIRRHRGGSCERKTRYESRGYAGKVRDRVKEERGVELEVYECPHCLGYHLTHQTADQVRTPALVARSG
jgi:hypothetical protein